MAAAGWLLELDFRTNGTTSTLDFWQQFLEAGMRYDDADLAQRGIESDDHPPRS